jgi:hypothetical protein
LAGLEPLPSICFQAWRGAHHASYELHQGLLAPSASELETFDMLFDGNLTASNTEAMDGRALPGSWKWLVQATAKTQGHLLGRTAALVLVVSFYVISKQEVFC